MKKIIFALALLGNLQTTQLVAADELMVPPYICVDEGAELIATYGTDEFTQSNILHLILLRLPDGRKKWIPYTQFFEGNCFQTFIKLFKTNQQALNTAIYSADLTKHHPELLYNRRASLDLYDLIKGAKSKEYFTCLPLIAGIAAYHATEHTLPYTQALLEASCPECAASCSGAATTCCCMACNVGLCCLCMAACIGKMRPINPDKEYNSPRSIAGAIDGSGRIYHAPATVSLFKRIWGRST